MKNDEGQLRFSDIFQIQVTTCDSMEHFRASDKAAFSGIYKAIHEKDLVALTA